MNSNLATLVLRAWTVLDRRSLDVAWKTITSHLIFVLRHPAPPQLIRLQAACTLDDILVIILRRLTTEPAISKPQCSAVFSTSSRSRFKVMLSGTTSSTNMDLCRLGLETPHQIRRRATPYMLDGKLSSRCLAAFASSHLPTPASYLVLPESSTSCGHPPLLRYLQEKRLFCVDQDRVPMYGAHVDGLAALYLKLRKSQTAPLFEEQNQ